MYKFFIEDDVPIEDYVKEIAKDGEWGSQLEMAALAEVLGFNVIVHQVDAPIMS